MNSDLHVDDIRWTLSPLPLKPSRTTDDLVVDLVLEGQAYRELVQQSIEVLRHYDGELKRLREHHHQVLADYRRLRESILLEQACTRPA